MNTSIWERDVKLPRFEKLNGSAHTDVLIIGGGLCGLLCAYFLKQAGADYMLTEADRIASGITKNTTAKITFLHGLIYSDLISNMGREKAKMYLEANKNAIASYREIFDIQTKSAYTYSLDSRRKIENEVKALNDIGVDAEFTKTTELPFEIAGAVKVDNQAQFNPLKFISHIANGLNIYENTFIRNISAHSADSESASIRANKIIVTTHFPFINKHGSYFLKLYQHRSYVAAYENADKLCNMYVDESDKGMSFSSYNNFLLIGGGGHRTGKSGGNIKEIQDFARQNYPKAVFKCAWAAQDCISLDKVPYIGRYSKNTPDLYVASGFNKWGMTSSMAAAKILVDMVMGKRNDFAELFDPSRSIMQTQLFANIGESVVNLLTPTAKRCPHMGCALKWNKAEHSWDCPCHGSRFESSGKLIDNPATGDAKIRCHTDNKSLK